MKLERNNDTISFVDDIVNYKYKPAQIDLE